MNNIDELVVGDLTINRKYLTVHYQARQIELTRREFDVLSYLAADPGRPVSKSELIDNVFPKISKTNTAEVYVKYIRNKLDRANPQAVIMTRRGFGYVVGVPSEA
ncbi:winged helix-turn-helix domain-containing protein [Arthrobacter cavernae]|uniref:Winged helix-turn-helix transcriptional regulator n=1 Tax=Arthrobacter cavernae TaxID=2817681 RepID=A0A939HC38_9MICC|nr:winged helix-turn-helix domain-containing protein [Arthrobacter cavernae]MBO1267066.1 winged helix-turn-helix transcriptional regulator [Arthrobacter cavernae]